MTHVGGQNTTVTYPAMGVASVWTTMPSTTGVVQVGVKGDTTGGASIPALGPGSVVVVGVATTNVLAIVASREIDAIRIAK